MNETPIRSGSHRVTNDVIYGLITSRIKPDARVLDFGAGLGCAGSHLTIQQLSHRFHSRLLGAVALQPHFPFWTSRVKPTKQHLAGGGVTR